MEREIGSLIGDLATSAETEARWDEKLPDIVWGLNNKVSAGTQFSPVELMFSHSSRGIVADLGVGEGELASERGRADGPQGDRGKTAMGAKADPRENQREREEGQWSRVRPSGTQKQQDDDPASASTGRRQLLRRRARAWENVQRSAKRMKATYDRKQRPPNKYKGGELVLWKQGATNTGDKRVNRKLANEYDGPFKVAQGDGERRIY